ncbi:MAG: hypothetical protein ACKVH1_15440, partial [Alphaproteobacteria bacterium]
MKKIPKCWAPWQSIQSRGSSSGITPCCTWFGERFRGTISEYLDSDYLKDIKNKMFEEELPKECGECNVIEASGGISDRAHQTQMKARWSPDETNRIINLDYRPSNLCNLKCRTCKPSDSSKIEAEFAMNKNLSNLFDETKGNDSEIYNTSVQKQPYDILEYEFPHLKRVVLLG